MNSVQITLTALLALNACAAPTGTRSLYGGLGTYHRATSTTSPLAQRSFDEGLLWAYGFNHDAAVASFREAQRLDPDFGLAYWGEAWALGPNINAPLEDPEVAKAAFAAARAAHDHAARATPAERALIDAIVMRYAEDPSSVARAALDGAFSDAMREAHARFPHDPDIGAIFADAVLNTRPWDYWAADGTALGGIDDALEALRTTVREHPEHPGAHHFLIHVTESSPHPEDGLPSARVLADLAPGAGHLVHMPAHTLHRLGDYLEAEECNRRAIGVDRQFFANGGPAGMYSFYLAHNHHFRAWAAMYGGRFEVARQSARDLIADLPPNAATDLAAFTDGFFPTELHVLVRFGKWDEVLAAPEFPANLPLANTMRRYARGIAFAATGRIAEARGEQQAFETTAGLVAANAKIGINDASPVIEIARAMLEGETLYREGRYDDAFTELRRAVVLEDALRYDEPSPWMMPVRHALGALLLEQAHAADAAQVYRDDLTRHPANGWSLHGLAECLDRLGDAAEAKSVRDRFELAWAHADTQLDHGSCFCRTADAGRCCGEAPMALRAADD